MSSFKSVPFALLLTFSVVPISLLSQQRTQQRGPSTAEERAAVIELAAKMQENPLDDKLQEQQRQLHLMLVHVPDIDVSSCDEEAPWFGNDDYKYSVQLVGVYIISNAAFVINNAEKPDLKAAHLAGLEGAIKAYQVIVARDPTARWKKMERLVAKKDKGELRKRFAGFCAAPLPLKAFSSIM